MKYIKNTILAVNQVSFITNRAVLNTKQLNTLNLPITIVITKFIMITFLNWIFSTRAYNLVQPKFLVVAFFADSETISNNSNTI